MKYYFLASAVLFSQLAFGGEPKPVAEPIEKEAPWAKASKNILSQATAIDGKMNVYPVQGHPIITYVFPEAFVRQLIALTNEKASTSAGASFANKVFDLICSPTKDVKHQPKDIVKVVVPPNEKGIGLDQASKNREEYLKSARKFLAERYFSVGRYNTFTADRADFNQTLNSNKSMIADFYSLPDISENGLKNFYTKTSSSFALLVVADKKGSSTTYLVPNYFQKTKFERETRDLNGVWSKGEKSRLGDSTTEKIIKSEVSDGFHSVNSSGNANSGAVSMFVVLDRAWKTQDGNTLYPMDIYETFDMALLDKQFTMVIPIEEQQMYFKDQDGIPLVCGTSDACGFDQGKKFSASKLLLDRTLLWDRYYKAFTNIAETPSADGSIITFDLSLKMDLFCKYGRAVGDLQSK